MFSTLHYSKNPTIKNPNFEASLPQSMITHHNSPVCVSGWDAARPSLVGQQVYHIQVGLAWIPKLIGRTPYWPPISLTFKYQHAL